MSRRSFAVATVLSIVALGVPLTGCSNLLADAHYNNALTKYNEGDYEAALKFLDNAIAISDESEYHHNRGIVNSELQNFEEAIKDFDKAIEIDPEDADSYYNRAVTREELGDTEGAMSDYNDAIKYDPESEAAYLNRGILKHDQGGFREAIEDYNKAIEINPNDVKAINNRGNSKLALDLLEESIEDFNQAAQIDPEFGLVYQNRGIPKALSGDMDGACNDWNKAVELGVKLPEQLASIDCKGTRDDDLPLEGGIEEVIQNPSAEGGGFSHRKQHGNQEPSVDHDGTTTDGTQGRTTGSDCFHEPTLLPGRGFQENKGNGNVICEPYGDKEGPGLPCRNQSMNNPRQETQADRESRLRYFEQHKEFILETLHYESAGDGLSEENKLRLTDAYLDIESDDDGSG